MKNIVKTLMFSATLAVAMLVAISAQAKNGSIVSTKGTVEYTNDAGVWQTAAKKAVIKPGTKIRTGATDSRVTFQLGNVNSKLILGSGASVAVEKNSVEKIGNQAVSETVLDLTSGKVTIIASGISGASAYTVKTPTKTVALKASQCVCAISSDGTVTVLKGLAEAAGVAVLAGKTLEADAAAPVDANPAVLAEIGNTTEKNAADRDDKTLTADRDAKTLEEFYTAESINVDKGSRGSVNRLAQVGFPAAVKPTVAFALIANAMGYEVVADQVYTREQFGNIFGITGLEAVVPVSSLPSDLADILTVDAGDLSANNSIYVIPSGDILTPVTPFAK